MLLKDLSHADIICEDGGKWVGVGDILAEEWVSLGCFDWLTR